MDLIWLVALCITHAVAYYMGKNDGNEETHDDDAWEAVKKYEIDKQFEYIRWLKEREEKHDA